MHPVVATSQGRIIGFMAYYVGSTLLDNPEQLDVIITDPKLEMGKRIELEKQLLKYFHECEEW